MFQDNVNQKRAQRRGQTAKGLFHESLTLLWKHRTRNNSGGRKCCAFVDTDLRSTKSLYRLRTFRYIVTRNMRRFEFRLIKKQKQQDFFSRCDLQKPQGWHAVMHWDLQFCVYNLERDQLPVWMWAVCWSPCVWINNAIHFLTPQKKQSKKTVFFFSKMWRDFMLWLTKKQQAIGI